MRNGIRSSAPLVWCALALVACQRSQPHAPSRPIVEAPRDSAASADASGFVDAPVDGAPGASVVRLDPASAARVAAIDDEIRSLERLAARRADNWIDLETVASRYLERVALTADYEDYRRAEDAIDRAFRKGNGMGPFLLRAQLNYTLHRLDRVTADVEQILRGALVQPSVRAAAEELRANVLFHSGRYDEARVAYERLVREERSAERLAALAQYQWKTGDFAGADRLLAEAQLVARARSPEVRAWLCLVRGLLELDRGRWPDALSHYRAGLALRPGYWLLEEHEAEAMTLMGEGARTLPKYLDLIERTGNPEFMDAAADILEKRGEREAAARWVARARAVYDARLRLFPEAVAGHAVEHFLAHDPQRAVSIAEANVRARPGGEAQVHLARALFAVGRRDEAKAAIDRALASRWRSAELYECASRVYEALGQRPVAAAHRQRALAINPHAFDE